MLMRLTERLDLVGGAVGDTHRKGSSALRSQSQPMDTSTHMVAVGNARAGTALSAMPVTKSTFRSTDI